MKEAARIVAILFVSRDQAHREHLKTRSYAQHVALGEFYDQVIDLADSFAETAQGLYGILNIPYENPAPGQIAAALDSHIGNIESLRKAFGKPEESCLLNIIDEISALFAKTLYTIQVLS